MDRLRNFTTQSRRRHSQLPPTEGGPREEEYIPATVQDGAEENINSSDYAKRCREIMDLYRDLKDLGYLSF